MKTYKSSAVVVGVLYIIGTLSGILSVLVTGDILKGDDFLTKIALNPGALNLGAFFILLMGLSLAAMPVFLYPIFKRKNDALALGMVIFRGPIEGSTYILFVINWLLLGAFSQEVLTVQETTVTVQMIGNVLLRANHIMLPVLSIVFIIGAMLLYILFYQTKLVPRWLSIWGMVGAVLYITVAFLKFFNFGYSLELLYIPLGVQEMVMAIWLIAMGFNQKELKTLLLGQDQRTKA